ncbi:MAG: nucleoside-diphosphate kinase [Saprospiraceae bacterium]|nr:nucleoside-diphosphate kinase [Saprospiraceae bacterium]
MAGRITFTMIKPQAVRSGHIGQIMAIISEAGFRFQAIKFTRLSRRRAEEFYAVHKDRPFFPDLVNFMCSGPVVAAVLEKDNAIEDYRNLIGSTNPADAADGTIRKLFAVSMQENAVHGSDSDENAIIEANFFFSSMERFEHTELAIDD